MRTPVHKTKIRNNQKNPTDIFIMEGIGATATSSTVIFACIEENLPQAEMMRLRRNVSPCGEVKECFGAEPNEPVIVKN